MTHDIKFLAYDIKGLVKCLYGFLDKMNCKFAVNLVFVIRCYDIRVM